MFTSNQACCIIPIAGNQAAKVEIRPKGFTLAVKAEIEKTFQSAPSY
jgi:hypothetical protein